MTQRCPKCDFDEIARPPVHHRPPERGEFSVCYNCGQIVQFQAPDEPVHAVAESELFDLPVLTRQQLRRMRQMVRERIERFN